MLYFFYSVATAISKRRRFYLLARAALTQSRATRTEMSRLNKSVPRRRRGPAALSNIDHMFFVNIIM